MLSRPPAASVEAAPITATPAIAATALPQGTADPLEIAALELLLADPAIQQAWSEQQAIGEALIRLMRNPGEVTSHAIEQVLNRYQAAMSLSDPYRAIGRRELFSLKPIT